MTEYHMYLQDIKSSPLLTGQNRLNLLTPGGIQVFRVLVQVWVAPVDNRPPNDKNWGPKQWCIPSGPLASTKVGHSHPHLTALLRRAVS